MKYNVKYQGNHITIHESLAESNPQLSLHVDEIIPKEAVKGKDGYVLKINGKTKIYFTTTTDNLSSKPIIYNVFARDGIIHVYLFQLYEGNLTAVGTHSFVAETNKEINDIVIHRIGPVF